jgi:N-acetylglucosamine kinase-like BadF-type ATPase
MKVIADCGATKSQWIVLHCDGTSSRLTAEGINVSTMSADSITEILSEISIRISATDSSAAEIHLYMAGIPSDGLKGTIAGTFDRYFTVNSLEIQSDLVGAARAVCGHEPGIAAIIGTGSNSCQFDGNKITSHVNTGGFILGDEASAATLGRLFISDFLKGLVPQEISADFASRFPSDYSTIVANVYKSHGSPSGYLGSFAPFIMEQYDHPYIKELVDGNIRSFFRRAIKQYDTDNYPVGIVGGFGYAIQDIISRIASEEGITISRFIKAPIDGLVEYHR